MEFFDNKVFGKTFKKIRGTFFDIFANGKTVRLSNLTICMRSFSSFGAELKKLVASQKRDRFPVRHRVATLIEYPTHSNETPSLRLVVTKQNLTFFMCLVIYTQLSEALCRRMMKCVTLLLNARAKPMQEMK